jgi:RNA ligase
MKDPILLNNLWKEVDAKRVTASSSGDLTIFKYTQDTHIKDLWNDVNRKARGIIFRTDGTIVARPFEKFFNLNERPETTPHYIDWNQGVEIYEKVDGSCGAGYRQDGKWKLATPGSMESEQAIEGTRILNEVIYTPGSDDLDPLYWKSNRYNLSYLPVDCTPVFEIIYPENRVVVDYKGARELVLLAIFEHNGEEWHPRRVDQIAELCGFRRPKRYDIDLRGDIPFDENSEGYVARFENGLRVKVKSPTYLRIHRLLDHLSPKGVVELIRGREYRTVLEVLPKDIAKDFDDVRAHVQGMHDRILTDAHQNISTMLNTLGMNLPRKQYAEWVAENVANAEAGFVFALLDNKDIEDRIWKLVLEQVKHEGEVEC